MSKKGECVKLLQSDRMKPFWAEIDRQRELVIKDIQNLKDGNLAHALDALDRVKDIPRVLESAAKGEASEKE